MAAYQGFTWVMNPAARRIQVGALEQEWGIPALVSDGGEAVGGVAGAGALTGNYQYWVTQANNSGHESNGFPLPLSFGGAYILTISTAAIPRIFPPQTHDIDVVTLYLYRSGRRTGATAAGGLTRRAAGDGAAF